MEFFEATFDNISSHLIVQIFLSEKSSFIRKAISVCVSFLTIRDYSPSLKISCVRDFRLPARDDCVHVSSSLHVWIMV